MQNITIAVSEAGSAQTRTFEYKVILDGEVVSERKLSPVQTSQVREMAMQYLSLLQGSGGGSSSPGAKSYLPILGAGLFHLFLESGWQGFASKILAEEKGRLIINSSIPEVLQLPWELLLLPGREDILGSSPEFSIIRHPESVESLSPSTLELSPGPLRVLFLAAERDFEREESEMLKVAEGLDLSLEISDSGTLEELKSLAESFRPHIVHLVGQLRMSGVQASFSMPGMDMGGTGGRSNLCSAEELAEALENSGARCIMLGGRQSEPSFAQGLLCQTLAEPFPMAVAWNGSTASASSFYRSLAKGEPLDTALKAVAIESRKTGQEAGMIAAFPALYTTCDESSDQSRFNQLKLFDPQRIESVAATVCKEQPPISGLTEGYAECFMDRRRDLHRIRAAMLDGGVHTLIITGPTGAGKSTLAVHFARSLGASGYSILPIYASSNNPISSTRILEAVIRHMKAAGKDLMRLKDPGLSLMERLQISIDFLKANRILMLWDGLDLDGKTGKIRDPVLADFYLLMLKGLGSGRAIITCSSLPAEALILPSQSRELKISALSETAFLRFLLQDEIVATRYRKGEVSFADLQALHSSFLENPAQLSKMRRALRTELSPGDDARAMLCAILSLESRQGLFRAAVFETAMSPAGFAAVAEVPVETAQATQSLWQSLSLAYEVEDLWAVPSPDRAAYLAELSSEERASAQKLAGDFLRDQAEAGRSEELSLSRLDCLLEARGHYLAAPDLEDASVVTGRISGYLEKRGHYSEIIRLNQDLLDLQPDDAEPLGWIARVYADQGDYKRSQEWYERAIKIAPVASAYLGLGTAYLSLRKYDLAGVNLQKAVDIYISEGDRAGVAAGLQGLASIDMEKNENEAAHLKLQKIAEISESLGDLRGRVRALQEMARLDMIRRDYETAQPKLLESLQLMQKLGDRTGEAVVLFHLASLYLEKGENALADQEFQKALRLARENGDRTGEATILHSLGLIHSNAGDRELAWENFEEALRIFQEIADRSGEAGAFFQLGALSVQRDKIQEGLRLMALAAIILRSIKSDEVENVEPLVEQLASQLGNTQEQFMTMVQEVLQSYVRDRGWGLVEKASEK